VRGLWAEVLIDDADLINRQNRTKVEKANPDADEIGDKSIGEKLVGWYGEVAYDVLATVNTSQQLSPYLRYEEYNTQEEVPEGFFSDPSDPFRADPARDVELLTVGIAYQPIPQVTIKLDFQDFDNRAGTAVDQFNVAVGYLF
jgi:hypothetical protein